MENFSWKIDQFADLRILRYKVDGFQQLSLKQKKLIYYLSQAAAAGRDIIFDQNYKHNLAIRFVLETVFQQTKADRNTSDFKEFEVYLKRIWFSNGIYHHYSNEKFLPKFTAEYLTSLIEQTPLDAFAPHFSSIKEIQDRIYKPIFDLELDRYKVCSNPNIDMVKNSANSFYNNIVQEEAESFYNNLYKQGGETPISYGLNSTLDKIDGVITETVWKSKGKYGKAIDQIVFWLEKANDVAETQKQQKCIEFLIQYYKTGNLQYFDEYSIEWVKDLESQVDFINGFIENYSDPLGYKATWEAHVNIRNNEATQRTVLLSDNAQWFEDNSPVDAKFKKKKVKGVSAKVIDAAFLAGDCFPSTPIGINLPNADWIRKVHGSKSVTIDNISYSYSQAAQSEGLTDEFALSEAEIQLEEKYGFLADSLHTDMHECLGHGSGQLADGISGDELKSYGSTIEEARADLFALYYMMDEKMLELGLIKSLDTAKSLYNKYIRNGLITQLVRIELGMNVEEAHMRNRKLIAEWCYAQGKAENVIEYVTKDGKTFVAINDYGKLRKMFGDLLQEIQRIKSTGDYNGAKDLVETYGVKIDQNLHKEILDRYKKLNLAPYSGFANPIYTPVYKSGKLIDIAIDYQESYTDQMLRYSKDYSFLPLDN